MPNWQVALSDANLRKLAGAKVFERGQTYAASDAVTDPELKHLKNGGSVELRATVMGTQAYECMVTVAQDDSAEGDCDCAHSMDGNFCKHQVAMALTLRGLLGGDAPEADEAAQKKVSAAAKRAKTQAGNRETLQVFVKSQTAAVLAAKIWGWAERDRGLMSDLKAWAAQARAENDPQALKDVITELLKASGFLDWRESGAYAHRGQKVLPLLKKAMATDPVRARQLCEHALRRIYKAAAEADDSNGEIGDLMHEVMDLMLRCLALAPPPADWLDDWFALMRSDPWGLWNEKAVLAAAGAAVQQRYGLKAAKDWHTWVERQEADDKIAEQVVLSKDRKAIRALAAQRPYHYDAQRSELRKRYLDTLTLQGDTLAVIEAMRGSLAGAHEHCELVAYCESVGKLREALQFAQTAVKLFPGDMRCENDLLRCYERDGWDVEALAIRRKQLEQHPSVERFLAVLKSAKQAGHNTKTYREELFAWVAERELNQPLRPHYGNAGYGFRSLISAPGRQVDTRVRWLLEEAKQEAGKFEEALALVQLPHQCQANLLRSIALRLPPKRNAEAVPLLLRVFNLVMPRASTPYSEEIDLVRELASRMPQPQRGQWLDGLRVDYKAKRNFIKGLDRLTAKLIENVAR